MDGHGGPDSVDARGRPLARDDLAVPVPGPGRRGDRAGRRRLVWLSVLTAVVTGAAGVAGFPNLGDRVRVLIVLGTAAIAGVIAVLQGSSRRDGEVQRAALPRPLAAGSERVKPDLFQMPPDTRIVNQLDAVSAIVASATDRRAPGYGPAVCVVSGKGGVGKTTLAVHVAHQVKTAFT